MPETPEDRTFHESNLCSMGPRPQVMTGLMLLLLREHFASADNIVHAVFRARLYTGGTAADSTGILIEENTVWTPTRAGKRPSLIIKRNGWKSIKRGTFNSQSGTSDEGHLRYTKLMRGSHTVFCVAKEGGETEVLTAETFQMLTHFGPIFRQYFKLMAFDVIEVGALGRLKEATDRYAVPITVAYGYDDSWMIREHVPVLRNVSLKTIFETYYPTE